MKIESILNTSDRLYLGDCRKVLSKLDSNSVHLVVTDPPYFLDGLDNHWSKGGENQKRGTGSVGGLPVGMKFDPAQGKTLQKFISKVGQDLLRVLKPGSYALFFSQPRLSHRMACGLEDAGFEIRDMYAWRFTQRAQAKAFSQDHFIKKMDISIKEKKQIINCLNGRKTPQLRPQFETIILAQKPREGTFVQNWLKHETGLVDFSSSLDGMTPSTVMTVEKSIKNSFNNHLTVKPIMLIEHLISLFSKQNQIVLDPFLGSGSTYVAAKNIDRFCIGLKSMKNILT